MTPSYSTTCEEVVSSNPVRFQEDVSYIRNMRQNLTTRRLYIWHNVPNVKESCRHIWSDVKELCRIYGVWDWIGRHESFIFDRMCRMWRSFMNTEFEISGWYTVWQVERSCVIMWRSHIYIYICIYIYTSVYSHTHTHTHVNTHTRIRLRMYIEIPLRVYEYMYAYTLTRTYIHIHTHAHTPIYVQNVIQGANNAYQTSLTLYQKSPILYQNSHILHQNSPRCQHLLESTVHSDQKEPIKRALHVTKRAIYSFKAAFNVNTSHKALTLKAALKEHMALLVTCRALLMGSHKALIWHRLPATPQRGKNY